MDELIDKLENAMYAALEDVDHTNRAAVLDVLALLLPPESFRAIIDEAISILRRNYEEGGQSQKEHVKYVLEYILTKDHENSKTQSNYIPPARL